MQRSLNGSGSWGVFFRMGFAIGKAVFFGLLICPALAAQWYAPPPVPTGLPSQPFSIRNIWYIGGTGPWDTMTLDATTERLFIAHGTMVQVLSVQTGTLVGEIKGLVGARAIALDSNGGNGYISDGPGNRVVVFDQHSLQTVATIATEPDPQSLVYEPASGLVFVVQAAPASQAPPPQQNQGERKRAVPGAYGESNITVIDPQTNSILGKIVLSGHLGYAQVDGAGNVYVGYTDRDAILRFNGEAVAADFESRQGQPGQASAPEAAKGHKQKASAVKPPLIDWTSGQEASATEGGGFQVIRLGQACGLPRSFALDGPDARLFAACNTSTLEVLNTATGATITNMPIGVGVDEIGFDSAHDYIFAASGAQDGMLTVVRRDSATDTYAIVQNLPTRERAYVMAVDAENGEVYLVTDIVGVKLNQPGGLGALRTTPVNGSFQVIEVGN